MVGMATRAGWLSYTLVVVEGKLVDLHSEGWRPTYRLKPRSHVLGAVEKRGLR